MEKVNFVNYKVYMNNKNNKNNKENQTQASIHEFNTQSLKSGVYLRDDHCDWGSSGMNEFTNEYSESN